MKHEQNLDSYVSKTYTTVATTVPVVGLGCRCFSSLFFLMRRPIFHKDLRRFVTSNHRRRRLEGLNSFHRHFVVAGRSRSEIAQMNDHTRTSSSCHSLSSQSRMHGDGELGRTFTMSSPDFSSEVTGELGRTFTMSSPDFSSEVTIGELKYLLLNLEVTPIGPIYQSTNKQLAELYLKSGNEDDAVFHLTESHAPTLRQQARDHINSKIKKKNGDPNTWQNMKERLSFSGVWHDGFHGLLKRLEELPTEWTVVQITMEYDPLVRFPPRNRLLNRGLGLHITRLSCGDLSESSNEMGEGGKPISVFVPAPESDRKERTLMESIKEHIETWERASKLKNKSQNSKIHHECNMGIEGTVRQLENWLNVWFFLFLGRLVDNNLKSEIKAAVDLCIASYVSSNQASGDCARQSQSQEQSSKSYHQISEKAWRLVYLCASSAYMTLSRIFDLSLKIFNNDTKLAKYFSKELLEIMKRFSNQLTIAKRYPVILVIDEDLDILPFEVTSALQGQSITRMPSIHMLHTLHYFHLNSANSVMKNGVDASNGFYVINPSNNLPSLERLSKDLLPLGLSQWKGVCGRAPSMDEFSNGVLTSDVFLYCGHGSGNQYYPTFWIDKAEVKPIVLLFGCGSNSLTDLGGRVEMYSFSNNFLLAGSPCVAGMLWTVLDKDCNMMTERLMREWFSTVGSKSLDQKLAALSLESSHSCVASSTSPRLLTELLNIAKEKCSYFMNKAATIVRGLPVSVICSKSRESPISIVHELKN